MDFMHRPRSNTNNGNGGLRDFGYNSLQINASPRLCRRSASPLMSPASGSLTPHLLQRNRTETTFPQTEDEQLLLFQERILWSQETTLLPLAHDLADWLSSVLGIVLSPTNLMETLETGVILCQLAKLIEEKASATDTAQVKPKLKGRMRTNAMKKSFFARDNIAIFINFCKDLGVHSNLLFETEDLVSHGEIRSICLCLLEVGRLSMKFGIDPPTLVAMEQQIDHDRKDPPPPPPPLPVVVKSHNREEAENKDENKENPLQTSLSEVDTLKLTTDDTNLSDSIDSGLPVEDTETQHIEDFKGTTDLDIKVSEVARLTLGKGCRCVEETRKDFRLRKLSEGKYIINGRTVFVRLLKGIHVMVRVGGGWISLEDFLVRNDPCRTKTRIVPSRRASFALSQNNRPASSPPSITHSHSLRHSTCSTPVRSRHSSRNSLCN